MIKAIGKYGELKAIEGEVEKPSSKKAEEELRVKEPWGVNPKVKAEASINSKYYIGASKELELIDLLEWTSRGLTTALKG